MELKGCFAPIPTFYNDDSEQSINYEQISSFVVDICKLGVKGIVVQGSTAEHKSLSQTEKNEITRRVRDSLNYSNFNHIPVIAGVGAESTWEAIYKAKEAHKNGANFGLALPPSYFASSLTNEALMNYYEELADKSPIPILIYSFPAVTSGINLDSNTIAKLAQHNNIVGIKQTDNDVGKMSRLSNLAKSNNFHVFAGASDYLLGALAVGAQGSITGAANFAPQLTSDIVNYFNKGDLKSAQELQKKLSDIEGAVMQNGIPGIKFATHLVFGYNHLLRKPYPALTESKQDSIKSALK